jgi:hypothetical protein
VLPTHRKHTQNQVKDMVPALGKLLIRNDDIAALEQVHLYKCSGSIRTCTRALTVRPMHAAVQIHAHMIRTRTHG